MTSVFVVEDNVLLVTTLVRFLREQGKLKVVGVAPSAEAALEQLSNMKVDVLLVDVSLPGMNGIDLVAIVHRQHPNLPCLMLSGHNEANYVRRALAVGASGYVTKNDPLAILTAIQQVITGETYLSEELRRKILH